MHHYCPSIKTIIVAVIFFRFAHALAAASSPGAGVSELSERATCEELLEDVQDGKRSKPKSEPIEPPPGSIFTSVRANKTGNEELAIYRTKNVNDENVKHAFVIIHGVQRNGAHYWRSMNDAVNEARRVKFPGAQREAIVIAPKFFSLEFDCGQYNRNQLAWTKNDWTEVGMASHPEGTKISGIQALDALIDDLSNQQKFPRLTNITIWGHSGGGQFAQRFAVIAKPPLSRVHVRFIHGNPSSCVYFTKERPDPRRRKGLPTKDTCGEYDEWRYGFSDFPREITDDHRTPQEYFGRYISRDVVSLVGLQDVMESGDQSCMARMQGGIKRRDRNLTWYRYVNLLARTGEDVSGFPGHFEGVPDWGDMSNRTSHLRLIVDEDATHEAEDLLFAFSGRSALFNDGALPSGWRPKKRQQQLQEF